MSQSIDLTPPSTLCEIEEALEQEILARESAIAVVHGHDQRIQELQALKDSMQSGNRYRSCPKKGGRPVLELST